MPIELPSLPYERSALEPHISGETIDFHHGKHQRAYVDKLNELVAGTEFADLPLEDIVRRAQGAMFNNAAQAWNHAFYWNGLKPAGGGGEPAGELAAAIERTFGDFPGFKQQFSDVATKTFGAGWAWLLQRADGSLALASTSNAATPLTGDARPLLTCDVWEHAYYIDYRNARAKYVEAFWNVVNWEFVASNMK